jgi:hypothetical protein
MKLPSKDVVKLEEAYQLVQENILGKRIDSLVGGFNMNPNRDGALEELNQLKGQTIRLYKHGLGNAVDTYEGPTKRPVRQQELTKNTVATGRVEGFRAEDRNLVVTLDGEDYNLTQDRLWVDVGGGGEDPASVFKRRGVPRTPGMR